VNCEIYDITSPGGIGVGGPYPTASPGGKKCFITGCEAKAGDGHCDVSLIFKNKKVSVLIALL